MRRIVISFVCTTLAIGVIVAQEVNRKVVGINTNDATTFSSTRCVSKGGVGIVNKGLYIVVNSSTNELIVKPTEQTERTWRGWSVAKSEIVVFYQGEVWSKENLPDGFDLSKSILISFESNKVRFFDFQDMSGGYYERIKPRE